MLGMWNASWQNLLFVGLIMLFMLLTTYNTIKSIKKRDFGFKFWAYLIPSLLLLLLLLGLVFARPLT
jgi:hypothetical protein